MLQVVNGRPFSAADRRSAAFCALLSPQSNPWPGNGSQALHSPVSGSPSSPYRATLGRDVKGTPLSTHTPVVTTQHPQSCEISDPRTPVTDRRKYPLLRKCKDCLIIPSASYPSLYTDDCAHRHASGPFPGTPAIGTHPAQHQHARLLRTLMQHDRDTSSGMAIIRRLRLISRPQSIRVRRGRAC